MENTMAWAETPGGNMSVERAGMQATLQIANGNLLSLSCQHHGVWAVRAGPICAMF
jgi:hypothetical protein